VVLTCFNPSEKYEFVNGKDDIPYMKWKMNNMFQTTNQITYQVYPDVGSKSVW
jgi:spore coat protein U-like protein